MNQMEIVKLLLHDENIDDNSKNKFRLTYYKKGKLCD